MLSKIKELLKLFGPRQTGVSINEKLISGIAALVGIGLIMAISQQFLSTEAVPWVVASMGASAVLLFAVPQGPLSQPWPFIAGHLISAFIGISVVKLYPEPVVASALAVALAIFVMYLTSSLHPPGGATALTAVIGGNSIIELGYWYMLTPIALNILVMLIWALIINNLIPTRCYPNGIKDFNKAKPSSGSTISEMNSDTPNMIHRANLHQALTEMDVFVDVSEDELNKIFNLSLMHTHKKNMGDILCRDIMTTDVTSVFYDTDIESVWQLMLDKRVHSFPVVDQKGFVLGVISLTDFLNQVKVDVDSTIIYQLSVFIKKTLKHHTDKPEFAGHLMTRPAITINQEQHILELFELFYSHNVHHIPVLNNQDRLVGIITPKDFLLTFQSSVR